MIQSVKDYHTIFSIERIYTTLKVSKNDFSYPVIDSSSMSGVYGRVCVHANPHNPHHFGANQ